MLESYKFVSCIKFKYLSLDLYAIGEETRCRVLLVRLFGGIRSFPNREHPWTGEYIIELGKPLISSGPDFTNLV
jgi:hypothetical protein